MTLTLTDTQQETLQGLLLDELQNAKTDEREGEVLDMQLVNEMIDLYNQICGSELEKLTWESVQPLDETEG